MNALPRLIAVPRVESCRARTVWHGESALLSITFEGGAGPAGRSPETLASRLNVGFGIRAPVPRLVLGDIDIDIAYRDERALESIELRTTPASWQRCRIDDAPAAHGRCPQTTCE